MTRLTDHVPLLTLFQIEKTMENNKLEKTVNELKGEVMDELDNPYRPYRVEFPYEVSFKTPQDQNITEIIVKTRSEEVRFGQSERDVMLQKGVDNRYGKLTYAKHILEWIAQTLPDIKPRNCEVEYLGEPVITPMTEKEIREFAERCSGENDDE
jgi:hypothetical protein